MNEECCIRKNNGKFRNRIDVKLVSNKKTNYLKCTSKPSYMSHKIFDNDFIAIRKSKAALTLKKSAYIGMCILELSKVLIYQFHYDYIKNEFGNNSRLLYADTESLMYEIKTELKMFMKDLTTMKKCLTIVIIHLSQNITIIQTN